LGKKGNKTGFLFLLRNIENSRNVLIKSRRLCPPRPAHQKTATIENLYVFVCPILYSVYVVVAAKAQEGGSEEIVQAQNPYQLFFRRFRNWYEFFALGLNLDDVISF